MIRVDDEVQLNPRGQPAKHLVAASRDCRISGNHVAHRERRIMEDLRKLTAVAVVGATATAAVGYLAARLAERRTEARAGLLVHGSTTQHCSSGSSVCAPPFWRHASSKGASSTR